ncbi:PREDICTED: GATA zinc finger domain-containing protein 14 [Rhagoletis zephyria]|uniref:GATA zinc finger domain-containing protein 14 n=1 Tax=Rhagoletis zephyria TaxID=28612 RepID=UPI000811523C|nr:PREDICTED: GATA zinc finger domain-containing protein 14 [Rhagoletis zephyria]XP_017467448.1 PREDICTED: GATA zinc finger domain-containing protein 14 [Rhagoletis zephyria]XP_017467449.1 PREDICTED: GATA zinc finger domain-containing protein 14 [Rhagoletis zephyria]XP_017467450.1 PREDICTED: GATA zinc finger domain-containing protein 14 [Rhagoletis zephyria]
MHFWIDKRSQQCGFGRSRVAASLSGAGGSGLSFGHPPRRISSGSGSKSSSRSALPDCHHSNVAGSSGSRSHQYQHLHQHQQLQQQQHQQHQLQQASNNNNFNGGNNCQQSHTHSSNNSNYTQSNSNTANITANAANTGASIQSTTASVTLNNNPHQYGYQQTQHHTSGSGSMLSHHMPANSNITNNNNATTSTSTATAADARGVTPVAQNFNQRGAALLQNTVGTPNTPLYQQHTNHCYDMRSYHHPQFGNMSVRHYQYPGRNCNGPTHTNAANSAAHAYRGGGNSSTRTIVGVTTAASSMSTMQHLDQMPYRQQHAFSHCTTGPAQSNESIMGGSAPISTNTTNTASYAVANTAHRYSSAAINMRASNMTVDTGGGDAQLLPSHLKCGMCASLVLASVFVAGAKFYFDHQGTGLEVLIFCAFSATFFLAACTVSLCRVPKGLLPSGRNAVLGAQQRTDADSGMHCTRAPYGRRDIMNSDGTGGGDLGGLDDIHGAPLCGQLQLIEDSASAGPPPYHIAIYFPETENSGKGKEAPIDDESPPPSYDKILI